MSDLTKAEHTALWKALKHLNYATKQKAVVANLAASLEWMLPLLGEPTTDEEREILDMAQRAIEASKR